MMKKIKQFFKNILDKIKSLFKKKEDKEVLVIVPPVIDLPNKEDLPEMNNPTVGLDENGRFIFK